MTSRRTLPGRSRTRRASRSAIGPLTSDSGMRLRYSQARLDPGRSTPPQASAAPAHWACAFMARDLAVWPVPKPVGVRRAGRGHYQHVRRGRSERRGRSLTGGELSVEYARPCNLDGSWVSGRAWPAFPGGGTWWPRRALRALFRGLTSAGRRLRWPRPLTPRARLAATIGTHSGLSDLDRQAERASQLLTRVPDGVRRAEAVAVVSSGVRASCHAAASATEPVPAASNSSPGSTAPTRPRQRRWRRLAPESLPVPSFVCA